MKLKLRKWQQEAGDLALKRFADGSKVFTIEAGTGTGKTLCASDVAMSAVDRKMVATIIVVTPSDATKQGWVRALNERGLDATDDPDLFSSLDFNALVISYAGYAMLEKALRGRPNYSGIMLIVDEYHHAEEDAAWGVTVSNLTAISRHCVFLSGTPWRSSGQIAVLTQHKNMHGEPYYQGDRVKPDYSFLYSDDLAQPNDSRGTIPVNFFFYDSHFTDRAGHTESLENPHLREMNSDEERDAWITEAMKSDLRIGKHVRTQSGKVSDFTLSSNELTRRLLHDGIGHLADYRARSGYKTPVLLVVTQSIVEARAVHCYMQDTMQINGRPVRSALIVSDKKHASDEVDEAREKCQGGLLDVIVSVGMVSEGVDIPHIKGVVYLSAILTILYVIQVIGRLLRRIRIGGEYMDKTPNHLPGFFLAPAAPKLCAIAFRIEEQIHEASAATSGGGGDDGEGPTEPPTPIEGQVTTTGDVERFYRGSEEIVDLQDAIEAMLSHDRAEVCHVDRFWAEWVLSIALSGKRDAWNTAKEQMEERCECLGIHFGELFTDIAEVAGVNLTMEQKHKLARREAEVMRQRVRHSCNPFKEIDDNNTAYPKVSAEIRRRCGFPKSWSFTDATLDEKRRWIEKAQSMLNGVMA